MGQAMDEKSATHFDIVARADPLRPEAPSSLPQYLILVSGRVPGAMLRLDPEVTRLGRAPDNTYSLYDASVSRHHALFEIGADDVVRLTDLKSTNGTYLNGRRIPAHKPIRIEDGDRIQLGASVVKFVRLDPSDERFQRELFERTVRDALTGLYNRAYFLDQLGPLADASANRGLGLAVLMLDIDDFKRINDTHGHAAGDVVLREVAGVLRESTRPEDLVARYGGEEFILALPVAAPDQATERAERIRTNLAARRIVVDETTLRVTGSLGLAYAPADGVRIPGAMIVAADHCLYQAKNGGRNRVVFRHATQAIALSSQSTSAD